MAPATPFSWSRRRRRCRGPSPDELEYASDRPLPKLGGHFPGLFMAAFADATVIKLPSYGDEKLIRALITADGGENIKGLLQKD